MSGARDEDLQRRLAEAGVGPEDLDAMLADLAAAGDEGRPAPDPQDARSAADEVQRLRAENQQLREQNAEQEARLKESERSVERPLLTRKALLGIWASILFFLNTNWDWAGADVAAIAKINAYVCLVFTFAIFVAQPAGIGDFVTKVFKVINGVDDPSEAVARIRAIIYPMMGLWADLERLAAARGPTGRGLSR